MESSEFANPRSASLEEDIKIIRQVGVSFMRSSTQGYQLLMARERMKKRKGNASVHVGSLKDSPPIHTEESETPRGGVDQDGEEIHMARSYDGRKTGHFI